MKHAYKWTWLLLLPGSFCALPSQALPGPEALIHSLSKEFLLHGSPGYLGVDVQNIDEKEEAALKLKDDYGAEIIAVDHDAPAAKAGLKIHDVILQMNGGAVANCDQLRHMLHRQPPGRQVTFLISRDGSTSRVVVVLADQVQLAQEAWRHHLSVPEPSQKSESTPEGQATFANGSSSSMHFMGILPPNSLYVGEDLNPLRSQLAGYFGVSDGTGLLVENVDNQSPADHAGLRAGDIILKVNSTPMVSRSDWQKAIRNNRGKTVQVTIMRDKRQQILTMAAGAMKGKS